jgi:hypothetical protein
MAQEDEPIAGRRSVLPVADECGKPVRGGSAVEGHRRLPHHRDDLSTGLPRSVDLVARDRPPRRLMLHLVFVEDLDGAVCLSYDIKGEVHELHAGRGGDRWGGDVHAVRRGVVERS